MSDISNSIYATATKANIFQNISAVTHILYSSACPRFQFRFKPKQAKLVIYFHIRFIDTKILKNHTFSFYNGTLYVL